MSEIVWSDRLCGVIREIAEEVLHEETIFALCRKLHKRGVPLPQDISILLEADCVVVGWQGREVARQFEHDPDDWLFEDGPWVRAIEEAYESLFEALPKAA